MAAFAAVVCTLGGVAAVTTAVVAGPSPGLAGYVSEAGIASSDYAPTYRIGVFGLAAGLLLFAVALSAAVRTAAILLAASTACTVLSGAVTCSDGCPLPPFEAATVADLVHGGTSTAAVATCVLAMLVLSASAGVSRAVRRLAVGGCAISLPLSAAVGVAMLTLGRGTVVGVTERVLLGIAALWLAASALRVGYEQVRKGRPLSLPA